jgi:hypothetical protein
MLLKCWKTAILFLGLCPLVPCHASPIAYVSGVNGNGEGGTGTIFGNGASGNGQNCTTYGNGPSSPVNFFGPVEQIPGGGIGPCGYFGGTITGSQPTSFTMSASNRNGSSSASGSASASLASSTAVVNGQNVTGEFTLHATASQSATEINGPTTIEQAVGAAIVNDPNWIVTAPGLSSGTLLQPTYIWALSVNAALGSLPFGDFSFELAMQQPSSQVNSVPVADYQSSYNNPIPSCGYTCGTGFTIGSGFMSGTGLFTFASGAEIPVGVLENEEVGLVVSANYNASIDPDATLVGVSFTADGVPVTDFSLTTSTGVFTSSGFAPLVTSATPEPDLWIFCLAGIVGIAVVRKLRAIRPSAVDGERSS